MKQVKIDQDECIGCQACVELCPDIFAFNEDENKAHVVKPEGGDQAPVLMRPWLPARLAVSATNKQAPLACQPKICSRSETCFHSFFILYR